MLRRAKEHRKPWDRISRCNFRNGISEASQAVIKLAAKRVGQIIEPGLRHGQAIDSGSADAWNGAELSQTPVMQWPIIF